MSTMALSDISIGNRIRKDMGDIESLAANIAAIGMLHPVVVRPDGRLVAGERRLCAAKRLGWTKIPVTVIDLDAVVRGEFAENSLRKDFTYADLFSRYRHNDKWDCHGDEAPRSDEEKAPSTEAAE